MMASREADLVAPCEPRAREIPTRPRPPPGAALALLALATLVPGCSSCSGPSAGDACRSHADCGGWEARERPELVCWWGGCDPVGTCVENMPVWMGTAPTCPGPASLVEYCGCDGRTFTAGLLCPPGPYAYEGACGDRCGDAWLAPGEGCVNDDGPVELACCEEWLDGGLDGGYDAGEDGGLDEAGRADGAIDGGRDGGVRDASAPDGALDGG